MIHTLVLTFNEEKSEKMREKGRDRGPSLITTCTCMNIKSVS